MLNESKMAVSGDITVAQDGGHSSIKLHPYLVTLVRWCVSCLWSSATVLLHRLVHLPLQPISGPKPASVRVKIPKRVAGTEHLHPEPKVECQLLHQPANHTMDVIFVHGLYGSLGNTWRQGDWRQKYVNDPKIVTLRDHSKPNSCKCHENTLKNHLENDNKYETADVKDKSIANHMFNENKCVEDNITELNETEISTKNINDNLLKKVIPKDNDLITEQFYNNSLLNQDGVKNYDTQAKFVSDLFKRETVCDRHCVKKSFNYIESNQNSDNDFKYDQNSDNDNESVTLEYNDNIGDQNSNNEFKYNQSNDKDFKYDQSNDSDYKYDQSNDNDYKYDQDNFQCRYNEVNDYNDCKCSFEEKGCEVGCGCICSECYSDCWPRDWIKMDFPGARVISINYTSDPYLWRPLWIKENKRLNLYQRAEQMMEQLLEMGVGEKPIIWVGHSKGGLFIKQIYCEAYEAFQKTSKNYKTTEQAMCKAMEKTPKEINKSGISAENIDAIIGHFNRNKERNTSQYSIINDTFTRTPNNYTKTNNNCTRTNDSGTTTNDNYLRTVNNVANTNNCIMNDAVKYENVFERISANNNLEYVNKYCDNINNLNIESGKSANSEKLKDVDLENGNQDQTSIIEDFALSRRATLWSSSRGFMFYSVPHRGSPLADIKTPVTARSVDLLEIAKDCPLVLELQSRWQHAVVGAAVCVRSMVETTRTLMSVLWLRIVSTDSADAGIGILSGISVDHREICKPSSRSCRLYTMLTDLIHAATTCKCH